MKNYIEKYCRHNKYSAGLKHIGRRNHPGNTIGSNTGDGAVIITVVCNGRNCMAGVVDTVAVANAALTPEQIQLISDGRIIEIRIEVTDISGQVPSQDKEVIEDGREFYIIRSHEGEYTLLNDMDNAPGTVTISTDMLSAYAIASRQTDTDHAQDGNMKCGLCHICPTFLGICCFIWLAGIIAASIIVIIVLHRKRYEGSRQAAEKLIDRIKDRRGDPSVLL